MPKGIKGFQKGYLPWNKGKHRQRRRQFSEQARENIQQAALKQRAIPNGKPFHKGFVITPEHREVLNESIRTKRRSYIGAGNPNFGKKASEETLQRISEGVLASDTPERRKRMSEAAVAYDFSGSRNGNWRGGRWSLWVYPSDFNNIKESIRERDGYTCQICGATENGTNDYELDIHHKDGNRFNNSEDNLVTLCRSCHRIAEVNLRAEKEVMRG